jgi:hypothetical protein
MGRKVQGRGPGGTGREREKRVKDKTGEGQRGTIMRKNGDAGAGRYDEGKGGREIGKRVGHGGRGTARAKDRNERGQPGTERARASNRRGKG